MNDQLLKVLRAMGSPYTRLAANRIEQLEAALREIAADQSSWRAANIARAALDQRDST